MATIYERLQAATQEFRQEFLKIPVVNQFLGEGNNLDKSTALKLYIGFLKQSYFHVRAASPTYSLAASKIDPSHQVSRVWLMRHAMEEDGHHLWIENDLKNLGVSLRELNIDKISPACDALVGYMRYCAEEFPFGMLADSFVIEGLSQIYATGLSGKLMNEAGLPADAVTYLAKHGEADQSHMDDLRDLINAEVKSEDDFNLLVRVARSEFWMYGQIMNQLI